MSSNTTPMNKYSPSEPTTIDDDREWLYGSGDAVGPKVPETNKAANETKQQILDNPTPLTSLLYKPSTVILLDWFTELAANDDHTLYNKTEISDNTGIGRPYVVEHIDRFVAMGLIEEVGENRKRYRVPEDDPLLSMFVDLNEILYSTYMQRRSTDE